MSNFLFDFCLKISDFFLQNILAILLNSRNLFYLVKLILECNLFKPFLNYKFLLECQLKRVSANKNWRYPLRGNSSLYWGFLGRQKGSKHLLQIVMCYGHVQYFIYIIISLIPQSYMHSLLYMGRLNLIRIKKFYGPRLTMDKTRQNSETNCVKRRQRRKKMFWGGGQDPN